MVAGIMILSSFFFIEKIRTYTFGLIFVMTAAEVISRAAYVANFNPPNTGSLLCYSQAFIIQYFISLSMYYSLTVAGHMYSLIAARQVYRMTKQLFIRMVTIPMVVALVGACIPFATAQYGNIGAFCWILIEQSTDDENDSDDEAFRDSGYAMRVSLMHGQIWVIYLLNTFFYIRIYLYNGIVGRVSSHKVSRSTADGAKLSNVSNTSSKEDSVTKTIRILQYYPIILIVTWCPLIVMRVFEYAGSDIPCWVYSFSLGLTNLQGLFNAIVFFSYDSVRQYLVKYLGTDRLHLLSSTTTNSKRTSSFNGESLEMSETY